MTDSFNLNFNSSNYTRQEVFLPYFVLEVIPGAWSRLDGYEVLHKYLSKDFSEGNSTHPFLQLFVSLSLGTVHGCNGEIMKRGVYR